MIEGSAQLHWAPTRCRGLSDSTARLGLRSRVATNNRHSPVFERG